MGTAVIAILDDIERRIRANGGNPVPVSGEHLHILRHVQGSRFDGYGPVLIGRRKLGEIRALKKRIEEAITEHVAFNLNPKPWIQGDGKPIALADMNYRHICNAQLMITYGRLRRQGCSGLTNQEWLRVFSNELLLRKCRG